MNFYWIAAFRLIKITLMPFFLFSYTKSLTDLNLAPSKIVFLTFITSLEVPLFCYSPPGEIYMTGGRHV